MEQPSTHRYGALDGLRGVAAIAVALYHFGLIFHIPDLFPHGYIAVDFFFALSGFVIGTAYDRRLAEGMGLRKFAGKRVVRLYPMVVLGMLIGAAWKLTEQHGPGIEVVLASLWGMTLMPLPIPVMWGYGLWPINSPTWSLFFELTVNLVYARLRSVMTDRAIVGVAIVSLAILACCVMNAGTIDQGATFPQVLIAIPRTSFSFFLGLYLWRLHSSGRLPKLSAPLWFLTLVFLAALWHRQGPLLDIACVAVLFPLIITAAVNSRQARFEYRLSEASGEISYPLYAIHAPALHLLSVFIAPLDWRRPTLFLTAAVALSILAALSWIIAIYLDAPLRARISGRRLSPSR
jgi:peptidoglycan/LPS O-acetylase OafA/YrhL